MSCAAGANAEDLYLHMQTADGTWHVYNLENVDKLTFTADKINALSSTGATVAAIDRTDLVGMSVDEAATSQPAGITDVVEDRTDVTVNGNLVTVNGDQAVSVEIFDLTGRLIDAIEAVEPGQSVDLSQLDHQVYIVKAGKSTLKITVK